MFSGDALGATWAPELRGTAYDLVVALCGRAPALEHLEGPGTDVLRERIGH